MAKAMCPDDSAAQRSSGTLVLESRRLRLEVDPSWGGKLRSLVSLRTGRELFYRDSRRAFDGTRGYSYHDISGIDECFPTVAACSGRTPSGDLYDYADHGFLWQCAWQARQRDGGLDMSCEVPRLGCTFHRRCSLDSENALLLEYRIVNAGTSRIPYVYSLHLLLAADTQTRAALPPGLRRAYNYIAAENFGVPNEQWFDLPLKNQSDLTGPWSLDRRTFVKLFTDRLEKGSASVEHADSGDRLVVSFQTKALPYMGFLASQGHDSLGDGHLTGEFLLALEPTTGIGDDIETCIRQDTLEVLRPGDTRSFWIRLTLEEM